MPPTGRTLPTVDATRARAALTHVLSRRRSPAQAFRTAEYVRHNQRRQEHLATLGLPLAGRSVLEVGAGIGDHTTFFLDRGCDVTITEGRPENVQELRRRFPDRPMRLLDLDAPDPTFAGSFDLTYCYGLLYHLATPAETLAYLAARTNAILLLETCVSFGDEEALNPVSEPRWSASQAVSGTGCRPTRPWVWARLAEHFDHVYATATQPCHDEFPLDWSPEQTPADPSKLTRSVFVASRSALESDLLLLELPRTQRRAR